MSLTFKTFKQDNTIIISVVITIQFNYTRTHSFFERSDKKTYAPGEDRTHDLQIALCVCDYETDALPTALPRHTYACRNYVVQIAVFITCIEKKIHYFHMNMCWITLGIYI